MSALNIFRTLVSRVRTEQKTTFATVLNSENPAEIGHHVLFDADGHVICAAGKAEIRLPHIPVTQVSVQSIVMGGRKMEVLIEPFEAKPTLVIMGSGHIAEYIAALGSLLSYEIVIVDDRSEYANSRTFPYAKRIHCGSFADILPQVALHSRSFAILVTRGHQTDAVCLEHLLTCNIPYIGMVGSRRKIRSIFSLLRDRGIEPEAHPNIHAPVGLDIHSETPQEIALSILAEIQLVRAGGSGRPLSVLHKQENIHPHGKQRGEVDVSVWERLAYAREQQESCALVTIIGSSGHVPRGVGSRMLVWESGKTYGTIGGGRRESEIIEAARHALYTGTPVRQEVDFSGSYNSFQPVCGGRYTFFVQPYIPVSASQVQEV
ncbi:XdhC family protein [Aneurinibacillus sp. REN35]|uniref:XdhC family protein n=1 Tax=Aneurinibacillus sp. REN35 TaxID=3237286 RepID=UPI0035297D20